jgi:hypothetical protein
MLTNKQTILAKIESVYMTDPVPVGSDALVIGGLNVTVYDGDKVTRDITRATLGAVEELNVAPRSVVKFSAEFSPSGDKTVVPKWGKLLRACGFSETQDATANQEKTIYNPVDTGFESLTLYFVWEGQRQKISGARGEVSFSLTAKGLPKMDFTFTGAYSRPSTQVIAPDFSGWQAPLPVTKENTPTWNVHGFAAIGSELMINMGNNVIHGNRPGEEKFDITSREVAGDMTIKAPTLATKDMFALVESHAGTVAKDEVKVQHGNVDGQILEIIMPTVQLSGIEITDLDGEGGYKLPLRAIPSSAGNDEISIISR